MEYVISIQAGAALEKQWKEVARINTSRQMFNTSLKNLCLEAIADYLKTTPKIFDLQRFSLLPVNVRNDLVKKLLFLYIHVDQNEMFNWVNLKEILSQLVANLPELNFRYYGNRAWTEEEEAMSGEYRRMLVSADTQMYQMLAQKCGNSLRVFHHGDEGKDTLMYCNNLKKYPVIMDSLLSLTNLQYLELNRHIFSNDEFVLLGNKLVNLVHLKCNLLDASWPGISEGLRPLKKLKFFRFELNCSSVCEDCSKKDSLIRFTHHQCLKEYPQLKVVGNFALQHITGDSLESNLCHSLDDTTLFGPRSRSQLQELILKKTITQSQAEWHKNVTTLRITWKSSKFKDYETLLNFKNIETLIFEYQNGEMPLTIVMRFLQAYGPTLKKFSLFSKNVLSVEEILKMCPNLTFVHLTFEQINNSINPHFDGFGKTTLQQLGNLTHLYLDWLDATDRPDVLVQMFTAPNLQYLRLQVLVADGFCLTKALHRLRRKRVIASKLMALELSPLVFYVDFPSNNVNVNLKHHWRLFLRFVCSHAPLLNCVKRAGEGELNMDDIVDEFLTRFRFVPLNLINST